MILKVFFNLSYSIILKNRHKNYHKEETEEDEAQNGDRICKGVMDWGWESRHVPAMLYAGKGGAS